MIYAWTAAVMAASAAIVWRSLQMANAMDGETAHGVRIAVCILAVLGLWGVLAPVSGDVHGFAEPSSWLLVGVGAYMGCDRRRPRGWRETAEQRATV